MAFKDIKLRVAQYTGLVESDANDLALIRQLVNSAAREVYVSSDLPGSLDEAVFTMDQNYQIAIPNFAANLRGIRQYESQAKLALVGPAERYEQNPWYRDWERFRVKTNSPLMRDISSFAPLYISAIVPDGGIVRITGSTINASRISETVTINSTSQNTVNQFSAIHSITSSSIRTADYTISDLNGNIMAILANNETKTNYQILLLSNYPWSVISDTQTVEILYKKAFQPFVNDGDEFVVTDYDDAIYFKFQANWDATRKGDEERAMLANAKSNAVRDAETGDRAAKQPDSRMVFKPTAGQRVQRMMKYWNNGPKDYFRP